MGCGVYGRIREFTGKRVKVKVHLGGVCCSMNGELGSEGGEETGLCGEAVSVQGPRDLQFANGATNASIAGGTEGEDWRGANGGEESPSLSSEEEEGGEVRTDSGYMLLPQDPEVMNGDEVDEDDGVVTGHTRGEDSSNTCEPLELQSLGDGSEPGLGESPRLTRWMERQVAVSDDKQGSSESPREERGGGIDGGRSDVESERWAKFSEVAPSTGSEDWLQTTRAGSAVATGPVEPLSSMEREEAAVIKQAMVGFSLPSSATPSWAHTVPESVWKAELIGGLKQKKSRRKKK